MYIGDDWPGLALDMSEIFRICEQNCLGMYSIMYVAQ